MNVSSLYSLTGVLMFILGLYGMIVYAHFIRKAIALNVMGSGIFLFLIALSTRSPDATLDPVPHGMVLTGIVVSVTATAFILAIGVFLFNKTGSAGFDLLNSEEDKS